MGSIMREHFPFFLAYFPDTARYLSQVLTKLLADAKRSSLWKTATTLLRQQHDVERLVTRGWDARLDAYYNATLESLIRTIPECSPLWFCFNSYEYLHIALDDAIAVDVLGEAIGAGVKMFRCAPDNLIWLTPNFDPMNFYHPETTQAHRDQVDAYVKALQGHAKRGRKRVPKGFPSYDAFVDYLVTVAREVARIDPAIPEERVAAYLIDNMPHLQRISAKQPDSDAVDRSNKARWIRKHLQRVDLTWDDIQERARIS
jgi:hypothetical protein